MQTIKEWFVLYHNDASHDTLRKVLQLLVFNVPSGLPTILCCIPSRMHHQNYPRRFHGMHVKSMKGSEQTLNSLEFYNFSLILHGVLEFFFVTCGGSLFDVKRENFHCVTV